LLLVIAIAACTTQESVPPAVDSSDDLRCAECEIVSVDQVIDANTLATELGEISMYGAFVLDHPEDCAALAKTRLAELTGSQVRIEHGPDDSVRIADNHRYVFTLDGISIEETLIREGLALAWTQDGQHMGWFLFQDAQAKANESGCLWKGWNAFQRGEPSEFRVPGLPTRN
jgi:endonuclease YncB( thermonuclease family)